jgi:hypothetical protein
MALVRKFTIGVAPFAKMFRVHGMAGAACDALLQLRAKTLADDYFQEVGWNDDRTAFAVSNAALGNKVTMSEENISFTKDCHDSDRVFSFEKALSEFKIVYGAINSVLRVTDIRRIGMVAEYRLSVGSSNPSGWLREKLTTIPSKMLTEKFSLRFEERELAADGKAPDPKKADFINYIYHFYDSAQDT